MEGEQNWLLSSPLRESSDGEQYGPLSLPVKWSKFFLARPLSLQRSVPDATSTLAPRRTYTRWRRKPKTRSEIAPAKLSGCGRHINVEVHLNPPAVGIVSRQP